MANPAAIQNLSTPEQPSKTHLSVGNWSSGKTRLIVALTTSVALAALAISGSLMALGVLNFSLFTLGALTVVALTGTIIVKGPQNVWIQTMHTLEMTLSVFAHPHFDKTTGCWAGSKAAKGAHFDDKGLATKMIELLTTEKKDNEEFKVVDLGCGDGYYVKQLIKNGFNAKGFDGNPDTAELTGDSENFGVQDLTKTINQHKIGGPFNCVISLEVGEHIPEKFMDAYINNLIDSCQAEGKIIISWALPGQGGYSHVNELPNQVVRERFKTLSKNKLVYDEEFTNSLRNSADLLWFPTTVMVFKKTT